MRSLTKAFTDNGNSANFGWRGGDGTMAAFGTFGSGTAKLQCSFDEGTTWIDAGSNVSFTANGVGNFTLAACLLRVNLAGATTPSLTVEVHPVKDFNS